MTSNPFWEAAEDTLRGRRVRVQTADGPYTGLLVLFHYNDHAVLLRDATTPSGDTTPTALVSDPRSVELKPEAARREIRIVAVDAITPQPYSVRDYDSPEFAAFVRQVRQHGGLANLPLVRPLEDDDPSAYQVVAGHKRLEAFQRAGLADHPVEVAPLDDWAATTRFIDDHFPLTDAERDAVSDPTSKWYPPSRMRAAYQRLREDWARERLLTHPAIEANVAVLEAADGAAARVHDVVTGGRDDPLGAASEGTSDEVAAAVADLTAETPADEDKARADLTALREAEVPLDIATRALRHTYTDG